MCGLLLQVSWVQATGTRQVTMGCSTRCRPSSSSKRPSSISVVTSTALPSWGKVPGLRALGCISFRHALLVMPHFFSLSSWCCWRTFSFALKDRASAVGCCLLVTYVLVHILYILCVHVMMHTHMHTCRCTHMCTCTHMHSLSHTSIDKHTHMHARTHTRTHTHTHGTHTHIVIHTLSTFTLTLSLSLSLSLWVSLSCLEEVLESLSCVTGFTLTGNVWYFTGWDRHSHTQHRI